MHWIFDGIILAVAALEIFLGYRRGFIRSVMRFLSIIVALLLALAFSPRVAAWLEQTDAMRGITDTISTAILSLSRNGLGSFDVASLFSDMPDTLNDILQRYGADPEALTGSVSELTLADEAQVYALAQRIAAPVVSTICSILAFLGVFFIAMIALTLATWLLDMLFELPALKQANEALGLVFGLVCALLLAWLLSTALVRITPALVSIAPSYFDNDWVDKTYIVKFFNSGLFAALLNRAKDTLNSLV